MWNDPELDLLNKRIGNARQARQNSETEWSQEYWDIVLLGYYDIVLLCYWDTVLLRYYDIVLLCYWDTVLVTYYDIVLL